MIANPISNPLVDRLKRAGWCLLAAVALVGCEKPPAQQAPPPAAVTVSKPVQRDVVEWDVYTGHLDSPKSVDVEARVSGLIVEAPFVEGSVVKKGQVLYQIDPRPFQADLDSKKSDLAKAKAQVDVAKSNFDRETLALAGNAVSKQDYDNAKATLEQAQAAVDGANAALYQSQLNLEWCSVTAEIAGRVSSKRVTVGNLISGGGTAAPATLLTTLQSVDPMYCYVDVDENSVLKYQKLAIERKRESARNSRVPCYVELGNETNFPHEGYIDFVDNHVDISTGTLKARGVLPNPTGDLTPGFFASMRVPGSGEYSALLIPDSAIMTDQDRRHVLVVGDDNIVRIRPVQLGALFGSLRAISSGLAPDDRVVINGQMHVRQPNVPVAPVAGTIAVNPTDFAQQGYTAEPGAPSTTATEPAAQATSDAAAAAADLRAMENAGSEPSTTQPQQPIMQITNSPDIDSSATAFSAASEPTSEPTTEPSTQPAKQPMTEPSTEPAGASTPEPATMPAASSGAGQ